MMNEWNKWKTILWSETNLCYRYRRRSVEVSGLESLSDWRQWTRRTALACIYNYDVNETQRLWVMSTDIGPPARNIAGGWLRTTLSGTASVLSAMSSMAPRAAVSSEERMGKWTLLWSSYGWFILSVFIRVSRSTSMREFRVKALSMNLTMITGRAIIWHVPQARSITNR